jgi:hypothetical protein
MSGQAVAKLTFARHLRQVANRGENGAFTVLTDSGRSVLLRLTAGHITSSHCRGRDIEAAIAVLAASETLRYTFSRATPESRPTLIGIDDFLRRIDAFVEAGDTAVAERPDARVPSPSPAAPASREEAPARGTTVREDLEALAVEMIGPVAQVVVEDALANNVTLQDAIEEIARAIPSVDVGNQFLAAARERFPEVDRDL